MAKVKAKSKGAKSKFKPSHMKALLYEDSTKFKEGATITEGGAIFNRASMHYEEDAKYGEDAPFIEGASHF